MGKARRRFADDRSGATAIEYALIAGLIGMVIVGALGAVSVSVSDVYDTIAAGFPG